MKKSLLRLENALLLLILFLGDFALGEALTEEPHGCLMLAPALPVTTPAALHDLENEDDDDEPENDRDGRTDEVEWREAIPVHHIVVIHLDGIIL